MSMFSENKVRDEELKPQLKQTGKVNYGYKNRMGN